ncbi:MAG: hypothetical protein ACYDBZ_18495 [Steroidobacteraceae bacterium]
MSWCPPAEAYAANCVRVNDAVLVAAGYPLVSGALERSGHRVIPLEVSEFRKMDGGLSCLSLRFLTAAGPCGARPRQPVTSAGSDR